MKQSTGLPAKITVPFGQNAAPALIRAIPTTSQIGIVDGAASYNDGFPPLTNTALASGGKPPAIQDFNGLLNQMSAWDVWTAAAGITPYDATFQAAIGGYPNGATVYTATATVLGRVWVSTVDNNTTNPDTGGAGWLALMLASDVLALIASVASKSAGRILSVQRFTSSGTYTPSAGMTYVVVEGVGGGGAGAGGTVPASGNVSLGAPGASGTWGKGFFTTAQVGASQPVTIGAGGIGAFQGNGTAGGTTSFGSLMSMPGGGPGQMLNNVATPVLNGSTTLGAAPTGANLASTLGIVQGPSYAFNTGVGFGGGGGSSPYGTGLGTQINTTGANGVGQGAGGSGTVYGPTVSGAGGYGSSGLIIITEYGYTP